MGKRHGVYIECVYGILLSNGILLKHKNKIMLFAAIWMDLETIILSELSQKKANII